MILTANQALVHKALPLQSVLSTSRSVLSRLGEFVEESLRCLLLSFDVVGKEPLGELEITFDGKYLFTVNLHTQEVVVYSATAASASTPRGSYPIPNPCAVAAVGDWRSAFGAGWFIDAACGSHGHCCGTRCSPGSSTAPGYRIKRNPDSAVVDSGSDCCRIDAAAVASPLGLTVNGSGEMPEPFNNCEEFALLLGESLAE